MPTPDRWWDKESPVLEAEWMKIRSDNDTFFAAQTAEIQP